MTDIAMRQGDFPRTQLGNQHWEFMLPDGSTATTYKVQGRWALRFQTRDREPMEPTPRAGQTVDCQYYDDVTRRIAEEWRKRLGARSAPINSDLIGYRLTVDQASRITHPDARQRFNLTLDNLTEDEARSVIEFTRLNTGRLQWQ